MADLKGKLANRNWADYKLPWTMIERNSVLGCQLAAIWFIKTAVTPKTAWRLQELRRKYQDPAYREYLCS